MPVDGSSPDKDNLEFPPEYPSNFGGKKGTKQEQDIRAMRERQEFRQQQLAVAEARAKKAKELALAQTTAGPNNLKVTRFDSRLRPLFMKHEHTTQQEFEEAFPTRPSAPIVEPRPQKKRNFFQRLFRL